MVAQEDAPLAARRYLRGLGQDLRDRVALLAPDRHEDAGHQREVERHVALVAADARVAEVLDHVARPLVGLGQQHPVGVEPVDLGPDPLQVLVRLLQVLAVGALALVQVRHRVQPEPVDAEVQPEPQHLQHRVLDERVLVVEVRLVGEEPVPVVLAARPRRRSSSTARCRRRSPGRRRTCRRRRTRRRSRRTGRPGRCARPGTTDAGRWCGS